MTNIESREDNYRQMNSELEDKTMALLREADAVLGESDLCTAAESKVYFANSSEGDTQYVFTMTADENDKLIASSPDLCAISAECEASIDEKLDPLTVLAEESTLGEIKDEYPCKGQVIGNKEKIPGNQLLLNFTSPSVDSEILPSSAQDLAGETQIRFLKAKLRVLNEEMDKMTEDARKKEECLVKITVRAKDAEEESARLQKLCSSKDQQIQKYKKMAEDRKGDITSLENQLTSMKKEVSSLQQTQRKQNAERNVTEVRLNRALEQLEKQKQNGEGVKAVNSTLDKSKLEELTSANRHLEKQKRELISAFRKQQKLIDILKRQKLHLEAAKVLSFTEEEFMKILDWGN